MSRTKRATAAVACVVGATAGLIGMSTPAFATVTTATASYTCTGGYSASTTWTKVTSGSSTTLEIASNIATPQDLAVGQIYTMINGVKIDNTVALQVNNPPSDPSDLVVLGPKPYSGGTISAAPNPLVLTIDPPNVTVSCTLVSSSGFPL